MKHVLRLHGFIRTGLLALFAGLALQGCGGSGGDDTPPTPDANPTGYYTNTGTATVNADAMDPVDYLAIADLQGMATSTQLVMLSDSQELAYVGTITVSQNSFSGILTVYETGVATQTNVSVSGTITQGSSITGALSGTGMGNGTFTLQYALDNSPVDNSMVLNPADWYPINSTVNNYVTITSESAPINNLVAGRGHGTLSNCLFVGRIDPIAGTHLYTVSGNMSNCDSAVIYDIPTYTGLASVRGVNPNDQYMMVLTNGEYGVNGEYER